MRRRLHLLTIATMLLVAVAAARADIQVVGIFPGKAVLMIDGRQRMLSAGQTSPEGIRLVSAQDEQAVLEIDGKREVHRLGDSVSITTRYAESSASEVRLWPSANGMYLTQGRINNQPVEFLVDTGATSIALNSRDATRLGINYRSGRPIQVATASGVDRGYLVSLASVQVGAIQLANVDAVVTEGRFPDIALLGMSFLGRIEMERSGAEMRLRKKH